MKRYRVLVYTTTEPERYVAQVGFDLKKIDADRSASSLNSMFSVEDLQYVARVAEEL